MSTQLPQYKCHKIVNAAQILAIAKHHSTGESTVTLAVGEGAPLELLMSAAWMAKHAPDVGGYFVSYEDGYNSYSPKDAFEAGYRLLAEAEAEEEAKLAEIIASVRHDERQRILGRLEDADRASNQEPTKHMTFGAALAALHDGNRVARSGWNGKGMWLILVPGTKQVHPKEGSPYRCAGLELIDIDQHIDMMTAAGNMQPGWLASQPDMLATDWFIVR